MANYQKLSSERSLLTDDVQMPASSLSNHSDISADVSDLHWGSKFTRSSSPIPVLLRSASSLLSRSVNLPAGSLRASTLTVITGMIGGGTFTFSYGFYKCGMVASVVYLVLLACFSGYTTCAVVWCAEQNETPSFRSLATKLFGSGPALFIQSCLLLLLWMICISYMTLTKNLLHSAVSMLLVDDDNKNAWYDNSAILLAIASVIPICLALQRKVSALRYASLFGFVVIVGSTAVVITKFFFECDTASSDPTDASYKRRCLRSSIENTSYLFDNKLRDHSYAVALFFGGYAAQFTVLPIYYEMNKRSPQRMTRCIASGFGITFIVYLAIAMFGFWTFPNLINQASDQNLIVLYKKDKVILVVQILLAFYVMSTVALFAHSFRKSLKELIYNCKPHAVDDNNDNNDIDIIQHAIESPNLVYVPISPEAKNFVSINTKRNVTHKAQMELNTFYHALITLTFLASCYGVAVYAQNIGQVNAVASSTILPIVGYVFPTACVFHTPHSSIMMKFVTSIASLLSVLNACLYFFYLIKK